MLNFAVATLFFWRSDITTIDNDSTTACSNERLPCCDCVTTHKLFAKVGHDQLLRLQRLIAVFMRMCDSYIQTNDLDARLNEALCFSLFFLSFPLSLGLDTLWIVTILPMQFLFPMQLDLVFFLVSIISLLVK